MTAPLAGADPQPMNPERSRSFIGGSRSVWLLVAGAVLLLIAGIVVAIIASRQGDTSYPTGSPQYAVATYLRLLQDGKVDEAYRMTHFANPPYGPPVSAAQFHQQWDNWTSKSHRITLVHSAVHGTTASVTVEVASFSGGPFGASDSTLRQTFTLKRTKGAWKITGPVYAYLP